MIGMQFLRLLPEFIEYRSTYKHTRSLVSYPQSPLRRLTTTRIKRMSRYVLPTQRNYDSENGVKDEQLRHPRVRRWTFDTGRHFLHSFASVRSRCPNANIAFDGPTQKAHTAFKSSTQTHEHEVLPQPSGNRIVVKKDLTSEKSTVRDSEVDAVAQHPPFVERRSCKIGGCAPFSYHM